MQKKSQEDKNWSREEKKLDKEMSKQNWNENLIEDGQF